MARPWNLNNPTSGMSDLEILAEEMTKDPFISIEAMMEMLPDRSREQVTRQMCFYRQGRDYKGDLHPVQKNVPDGRMSEAPQNDPKWGLQAVENLESIQNTPDSTAGETDPFLEQILDEVRRATKKKQPMSILALADKLDAGPSRVREGVNQLATQGYRIAINDDGVALTPPSKTGYVEIPLEHYREGNWYELGIISDTHLCNMHSRIDVCNSAYDLFAKEGIRVVLHAGNYIDGAKYNPNELVTGVSLEAQMQYFLDNYPQREDITTFYVDGDDHEGWYSQAIGLDVGRTLMNRAKDIGRNDLQWLGVHEVDIPFWAQDGNRPAFLKLMHGGGGSSYAISYAMQKIVESFSSGEKPQAVVAGHLHKEMYAQIRGVHSLLAASTEDQTLFQRKNKLSSVVGFHTIRFKVDRMGIISRFQVEWFPFYNVGFYKDRYSLSQQEQLLATPHDDDAEWITGIAKALSYNDQ